MSSDVQQGEQWSADRQELLEKLLEEEGVAREDEGRIPRREDRRRAPLSFGQQRLWFLHQFDPSSPVYNIASALHLEGELDLPALAWAFRRLVRRHDILRTTYAVEGDASVQRIHPEMLPPLPVVDLTGLPPAGREAERDRLAAEESLRPFDLEEGPVLRTRLLRLDEESNDLLLTLHHIASDAWSSGVMIGELARLYRAAVEGTEEPMEPLPIQYGDFAAWQRRVMSGERLEEEVAVWRDRLAGVPVLELPTDRPRPAVRTVTGASHRFRLPENLGERLGELARGAGVSLFTVLLTGFELLLARLAGTRDVVVGTPVANRTRPEIEELVGFFVNTLVLRTDLGGKPSFLEAVRRVHETVAAAQEHQDIPFEKLVDELAPERDLSYTPLFQVMFVYQGDPGRSSSPRTGLRIVPRERDEQVAKFDLTLVMSDAPTGIEGALEYNADLFDPTSIRRIHRQLETLLAVASDRPDSPWSSLDVLPRPLRHQVLREWGDTARRPRPPQRLDERVGAVAERLPEAVAVRDRRHQVTYRELLRRSDALARELRRRGVGPDVPVAVCAERSVEMMVALLGTLRAGGAYLPLDPDAPAERSDLVVADAGAPLVLAGAGFEDRVSDECAEVARIASLVRSGADADRPPEPPSADRDPRSLAYVIYTSGSTGTPKGVMVGHRAIVNRLDWMQRTYRLGPGDRVLQKTPYFFDVSLWELFWPLLTGRDLVFARPGRHGDPDHLVELIEAERVTVMHFVPSMLQAFLDRTEIGRCTSLRQVVSSGEVLSPELAARFRSRSDAALDNLYGPTEAAVDVTRWRCSGDPECLNVPIGRPIDNVDVRLVDADGRPVPPGVPGELMIGGVALARGYAGRRRQTAATFVPDHLGSGEGARLYRSGDLARWRRDGAIEFLGRLDHQVKVRGFRIEPGEIEASLAACPGVGEAVVVARTEGSGSQELIAYLTPEGDGGSRPEPEALRRHLQAALPAYMVPAAFVTLDELPLTPSGKLDRRSLPEPGRGRERVESAYVSPSTPAEEILAAIWSRILGVDRVGIRDDFFRLGGDSILSIQVVSRAREQGVEFALPDLFRHPTIAGLLEHVATGGADALESISTEPFELVGEEDRRRLPEGLEDAYPLARMQAGMLYHMELTPEEPPYHNVDSWHLRCPFETEPFQAAVDQVVSRHPALRTSFALEGYAEALQLVHADARLRVWVSDLRGLGEEDQERVIDQLIEHQKTALFDLARPPLLRLFVHRRAVDRLQLTVTENHAIQDGWSLHSTLSEIFTAYLDRLAGGDGDPRPAPPVPYRDFIAMERRALEDPGCRSYWDEQLAGYSFLRLPRLPEVHRTEIPEEGDRIREWPVVIEPAVGEGLQALAQRAAVPLKSVLLAAHLRVLGLLGATDDVTTGLILNGRPEIEGGEEVRGLFLNTLPLRLRLGDDTWQELARRTFAAERRMLPYRRFPTAELKRRLGGDALFETTFNYVHFHVVDGVLESGEVEVLGARSSEKTGIPLSADFKLDPSGTGVGLDLEYDAGEIDPAQMDRMAGYYVAVLTRMGREPDARVRDLDVLSEGERRQLLEEWVPEPVEEPEDAHLPALFGRRVAEAPDRIAVVAGQTHLSYRELDRRAGHLAHRLRRAGVETGSRVPVAMGRAADVVTAVVGIANAGAAFVPIDPAYGVERLSAVLDDVGSRVLVTRTEDAAALPDFDAGSLDVVYTDDLAAGPPPETDSPRPPLLPEHPAYTIYTSGSTGRPKGVTVSHRNLLSIYAAWERDYELRSRVRRHLQTASIAFDVFCGDLVRSLGSGGTLVLCPRERLLEPERLLALMTDSRIDTVELVPAVARGLTEHLEEGDGSLDGIRLLVVGSDSWHTEELRRLSDRLGPDTRLVSSYGVTEATIDSSRFEAASETVPLESPVPIGRPFPGTRTYVLDGGRNPVPVGVPGELCLGGAGVSQGYAGQPATTAESFVPDSLGEGSGARLYRTGDLARYFPDGNLELLGRVDDQIKLRGFRVEPGEIEAVLAEHPDVHQVVVLPRPEPVGDGLRLVAYVVPQGEEPAGSGDLRGFVNRRLPSYMVPALVLFLDELPLTPNGKVDRRALPEPEEVDREERPHREPETPAERQIAEIWSEVLGRERVGRDDDFFDLGGHSLLATQVTSRVRDRLEVAVPLRKVFEEPRLERFAAVVEGWDEDGGGGSGGEIRRVTEDVPVDTDSLSDDEVDSLLEELMEDGEVQS